MKKTEDLGERVNNFLKGLFFSALAPLAPLMVEAVATGGLTQSSLLLTVTFHCIVTATAMLTPYFALFFGGLSAVAALLYLASIRFELEAGTLAFVWLVVIFSMLAHFFSRLVIHLARGKPFFPWDDT